MPSRHLSIDTTFRDSRMVFEYRYPVMCKTNSRIPVRFLSIDTHIDTLSCRSAFNAGRKLPNGSVDDLTYQNGWKSIR
ncbi:hypothetical protein GQ457_05G016130 [Hibiscus cannabinus]